MQFLDLAGVKRIKQYIDDSIVNFITNSVSNLTNYYLKSETYTKSEVEALIAAINQFHYEIAASTSAVSSPANNVLYLIGPTGTGEDKYEEYVYSSSNWVKIGDTSISLSGYVTTQMLNTALADYTNTTTLNTLLAGKQDTINDLSDIRTGSQNNVKYTSQSLTNTQKAQARTNIGAGTYSKPSSGIPATDLAAGVVSVGLDNTGTLVSNISTANGLKYIDGYDGSVYALGPSNADGNEDYILATTDFVESDYVDADTYAGDQETISGALTDLNTRVNGKQDSMVMLTYGTSTWNDFITAYNKNAVVYCYVPTDANGRLAFMAWKTPDFVEFQYYRTVSSHSATQQGDQVFIYKLTSANAWSTTTREAMMWTQAGNGLQRSVSGNNLTYSVKVPSNSGLTVNSSGVKVTTPLPSTSTSDNGKVLSVVDGAATWASNIVYIACHLIISGYSSTTLSDGRIRVSLIEDSNFPEFNYTEFNTARSNGKIVMCVVETSTTDRYYLPFYYTDNTEILFAIQSGVEVHLDIDNADHIITQADAYLTNFNGTYNSLAGKPTIPTTLDQISDGNIRKLGNVTVDDDSGILSDSGNALQFILCTDGAIYAIGSANSNGDEDLVLATTDQIPTAITTADIQAGTATTARTITAAVLAANYNITDGTINIAGDSITIKTARIEVNNLAGWTSETGYSTLYTTIVNSLKASSNNLWRLAITEDQDPYWPMTYYYLSYFGEEDGFIEFIGSDNTTIALWNNGNIIKSVASPITPGTLITNATTAQTASNGEAMSGTITLHKIAKTGTYSDLIGTPTIPTKVSDLTNDSNFTSNTGTVTGVKINGTTKNPTSGVVDLGTVLTSYTETDPTVPSWAKQSTKPTYTAAEVGALPDTTVIPTVPTISTNVVSDKASDVKTSSPKSVYSEIHPTVVDTQPSGGFVPNIFYRLGTITGSATFSLVTPTDNTIENEYHWSFTAGNPAPTITWPSGIEWVGGESPTINAGQKYEISILDNIAGNILEPVSSSGGGSSYTLPIASASGLGGIKVGSGLSIDSTTGVLSATGGGSDISDVTLGGTSVVSNGVAVLPSYPTTLPASDVSAWAKASTKPTYTASEVGALPDTTSIPTESTVAGWGFTKNTGTYSKPSGGIPATDLASAVQTSLGKADTALQSYTETDPVYSASAAAGITSSDISNWNSKTSNVGTITGITMNGSSKGTSGVVNLGTVLTAHQDISGKANLSGAAFTGAVTGTSSGNTAQFRNITISSSEPTSSQGSNGDIWIVI